jgi:AcrR family transcriptional regulator
MSAVKQADPRANQKARTREAIVAAANELHRDGITPTVEEAAKRARVSRATAYRYFPTKDALRIELAEIAPSLAPLESTLKRLQTNDVEQRLLGVLDAFDRVVLEKEEHYRTAARVFQDTWLRAHRKGEQAPIVREGRRMRWLDEILAPLDGLPAEHKERLKAALSLTLGIDPIIIMKDVCRLGDEEALAILRWVARALLRAGLEEAGLQSPPPG